MDERVGRTAAAVLWTVPVVVAVGWLLLVFGGAPADGTVTADSAHSWSDSGIRIDELLPADSPLSVGDRVIAVQGIPVAALGADPDLPPVQVGDRLTYTVRRAVPGTGQLQTLDVPFLITEFPLDVGMVRHLPVPLLLLTMYLVSTFVVIRRPRQPAARTLYAITLLLPVTVTAYPFPPQVLDLVTGRIWPFVVSDLANCLIWGTLLHFALVFPDPLPLIRHRPALLAIPHLLPFASYAARLLWPLPEGDHLARLQVLTLVSQPAAHLQPLLIAAAMVASYRAAQEALTRRRMRWAFLSVATAAAFYVFLGQIPARLTGEPIVPWDWLILLFVPFPVSLGMAVLRYALFDIEVIIRRSLVLGGVTIALGAAYLLVVAAVSQIAIVPGPIVPFAGSLVVAALFEPARRQIRRAVSRSLFGDRDDPYEVMDRLGQRLSATGTADSVLLSIVQTLTETLRLSHAAIRLEGLAEQRSAPSGAGPGAAVRIPILHAGERVGELEIDPGSRREPFGVADRRLLDGLARQIGMISQNLLLETRLRYSLERLVTTREEERRRLRRDLHDGLGPSLATSSMQLELAASLIDRDPVRAQQILTDLSGAQREAVAGLRRLVDGLRPPVLDRLGLVGALRDSAEAMSVAAEMVTGCDDDAPPDRAGTAGANAACGGLRVSVQAEDDVEPLPAAVEVAAYRLTQEALTNVLRHARARQCLIRLWRTPGALMVQVSDDGCGLPTGYRAGVGIGAIRERATELGGSASVTAGVDGGTVVFARLPVRDGPPGELAL